MRNPVRVFFLQLLFLTCHEVRSWIATPPLRPFHPSWHVYKQQQQQPQTTPLLLAKVPSEGDIVFNQNDDGDHSDNGSIDPDEDNDDEEEDYKLKLRKAEVAIAEAEKARKKFQAKNGGLRPRPPPNSLARIESTDAGTLIVNIPSKGWGSDSIFTGAFSMAWFSAIIPATFASGGASLLFMLPFWAAGGLVAKGAVFDPFVSGKLTVGEFYWSVENQFGRRRINQKEGATEQLRGAKAEVVAVVNERPQAEIKLFTDSGITAFGLGLGMEELEYLAGEINDHLERLRTSKPPTALDLE